MHDRSTIDILNLPLVRPDHRPAREVFRDKATFTALRPWAVEQFGLVLLRRGVWQFECANARNADGIEVRLVSEAHPFLRLTPIEGGGGLLELSRDMVCDLELALPPWPASWRFDHCRLRRLSRVEAASLLVKNVVRVARSDRPVQRIATALRYRMMGRPVGIAGIAGIPPAANGEVIAPASTVAVHENRLVAIKRDGLVAIVGREDRLDPNAWMIAESEFLRLPEARVLFGDLRAEGRITPRPEWDCELSQWFDQAGPPMFFRSAAAPDPAHVAAHVEGIAAAFGTEAIRRIALPLMERRAKEWTNLVPVPPPVLAHVPNVTVVIPTRHRMDLLEQCLTSLCQKTDYSSLDVVLVDNGCPQPQLAELLGRLHSSLEIQVIEEFGDFNFPRLVNAGVSKAKGEIVVLLNDDIVALEAAWLSRMVETSMQEGVGVVGARLVYPDGATQHAGVFMGVGGVCGHLWKGLSQVEAGANPYVSYPGERRAVTGACMAVRRDIYMDNGGYDETFAVAYNDVDFCLRLGKKGLKTIYRGDAVLIHKESQSRGQDDETPERIRRYADETAKFMRRWKVATRDDPSYSPAFDPASESGRVRASLLKPVVFEPER